MKQYKLVDNIFGWVAFIIAAFVYCSTIEPTASFWDCPEFITTAYKQEIGHPPGAPFFMLMGNFFTHFASDTTQVAKMVNTMSALLSAVCIMFLFWTITHLARKLIIGDWKEMTTSKLIAIEASGMVGALIYTFSDTFWFSAVEGEVYAFSSAFTAVVFWLILKWEDHADEPHSDRWLVLIAYMTGLSIGVHLLNLLCTVPGDYHIRFMTSHPKDASFKLIDTIAAQPKICKHLHLPVQCGSDRLLVQMNRHYTVEHYLELIEYARKKVPGITFSSDIIVGFPGETEEQFEDLCNFVKEVRFDRLGCFAYSAEENTVAAKMDGQIDQETKDRRAELVMQIQTGIMAQKQAAKVGQTVRVLCDGVDDESGLYLCRTAADAPEVDGNVCVSSEEPLYPGQFYDVLVDDSDLYDLYGTVVK